MSITDADGNTVGVVDPKDGGVRITDADGNTVATIDPKVDPVAGVDPKDGGLVIRDAGGNLFASVDPKIDPVASIDPKVDPVVAVDPKDDGLDRPIQRTRRDRGHVRRESMVWWSSPPRGWSSPRSIRRTCTRMLQDHDDDRTGWNIRSSYDISRDDFAGRPNNVRRRPGVSTMTSVIALKDVPIEGIQSSQSKGTPAPPSTTASPRRPRHRSHPNQRPPLNQPTPTAKPRPTRPPNRPMTAASRPRLPRSSAARSVAGL